MARDGGRQEAKDNPSAFTGLGRKLTSSKQGLWLEILGKDSWAEEKCHFFSSSLWDDWIVFWTGFFQEKKLHEFSFMKTKRGSPEGVQIIMFILLPHSCPVLIYFRVLLKNTPQLQKNSTSYYGTNAPLLFVCMKVLLWWRQWENFNLKWKHLL